MSDEGEDFEEQLRLEQLEKQRSSAEDAIEHGRVRKDEDGTEYEWDAHKKAWFPRVSKCLTSLRTDMLSLWCLLL